MLSYNIKFYLQQYIYIIILRKMAAYAKNLKNQTDLVIKQSSDRRKEIQQLINAVKKRVEIQQIYAKGLDSIGRMVQNFMSEKNVSSLIYDAFQSDNYNRAIQARALSKSLQDQVLTVLEDMINTQNNESRNLQRQVKRLEKELVNKLEIVKKLEFKYKNFENSNESQLLEYQACINLFSMTKQRRIKLRYKSKQLYSELLQLQKSYKNALNQYHIFRQKYYNDLQKHLQIFQQHEMKRIQKQLDTMMKILIFETSMIKNFEYDINNLSNQLSDKDPILDINSFIQKNSTANEKYPILINQIDYRSLLKYSIYSTLTNQFYDKIEFQKNIYIKKFLEFRSKGVQNKIDFVQNVKINYNFIFDFVKSCWQGIPLTQQSISNYKKLIDQQHYRHFVYLCFQQYLLAANIQLKREGVDNCICLLSNILSKCFQKKDTFVARKIINLTFNYYVNCNCKEVLPNSLNKNNQQCNHKIYLSRSLKNVKGLDYLKEEDFWEASIFQAILQQFYLTVKPKEVTQEWNLMRQKTIVIGQLASFCHNIVMFGISVPTARDIIGRYCRLYCLPDDQNRDLSRSISIAYKKYNEMYPQDYEALVQK